jgi:YHS domain-containing protein
MIRVFFEDFILPLLLFLIVRSILGGLVKRARGGFSAPHQPRPSEPVAPMELKKDPVCGTYVSPATGVSRTVQGHMIYFCSKECRDKFVG